MKKSIILSALVAAALGMTSCDDFLNDNRYPLDQQTNNPSYWENEANVQKQCDNLYLQFGGYDMSSFYFATGSDNNGSGTGGGFVNWHNVNVPAASSSWNDRWTIIRQCCYIIDNVANTELVESKKNRFIGIARMIRAQQYYRLVRAYGDVPYVAHVLDPAETAELEQPRMDRDLVMDKVYEDLKFASENIGSGSKTTWSSDQALAMLAEITLYEGTYCKYRTQAENYKAADPARAKTYLEYAAAAANELMGKGYSLNDSYIGNYNSVSLQNNPEMIFCKAYKEATLTHDQIRYTVRSTQIAGMSKDAFDSYLFKDGKPLASTTCVKDDAPVIKDGIATGTDDKILYLADVLAQRDGRLAQTIDTVVCYGTAPTADAPGTGMVWSRAGSDNLSSSTGYLTRKFDNTDIPLDYRLQNNYTWAPVYWLSYIYCIYAEAKAELGTLTDADLNASINKLYARAGLPNQTVASLTAINDPANNMGVSSLIWEVRRCRRCELMFDADFRYWDLIRWHQLEKMDTNKYPNIRLGANVKNGTATAFTSLVGDYVQATPGNNRVFEARQYLYPIPTDEITLSHGNLTQNSLWK